jgi:ornithine--oxo-acid transaminase
MNSKELIDLTERYSAHNYAPLEVVLRSGDGAWVEDVEGKRYLDFLAAYSALNFGHKHPRLLKAAHQQLSTLTLTSRAFFSESFALACKDLAELCGKDKVLFMNSGAEAVETAVKAIRKWGYEIKGIPNDRAEIIVCRDNFHGRTTTIVGFSTSDESRAGFGPFPTGFRVVTHGDAAALEDSITDHTAGVIFEPIQGEAGVVVPSPGYLSRAEALCRSRRVLLIADEVQTGLGRTGSMLCCDHEGVRPDILVL